MRAQFATWLTLLSLLSLGCTERRRAPHDLPGFSIQKTAPFLVKGLYRERIAGTELTALTETEKPINDDDWFWTDDNAKALEALSVPEIFPKFTTEVGRLTQFVIENSPQPFVFRRRASGRLVVASNNPSDFSIVTGLMNFHGNLQKGEVRQSYRFHDGRTEDSHCSGGEEIRFSVDGIQHSAFLRDTIVRTEIRNKGNTVELEYASELRAKSKLVGEVTVTHVIDRDLPYVRYVARVKATSKATLEQVRLSASLDQLDAMSNVRYSEFFGFNPNSKQQAERAAATESTRAIQRGHVKWWALTQDGTRGFTYAILSMPEGDSPISEISATEKANAFHRIRVDYEMGTLAPNVQASRAERRALTAGGLYGDMATYDSILSNLDRFPAVDLSISYDIGAELNGVAAAYHSDMHRLSGHPELKPVAYVPKTRKWFDDILAAYEKHFAIEVHGSYPYAFPRGLAFVILAVDTMYKATGDNGYFEKIRPLTEVLLTFQSKQPTTAGSFRCLGSTIKFDCHAAGIIAAARAAVATRNPQFVNAARRGLHAYQVDPNGKVGEDVYVFEDSEKVRDTYFWTFKAGLLLRSLDAIDVLVDKKLLSLDTAETTALADLRKRGTDYILKAIHPRENLSEIYTSSQSTETNSETQSWVALGLYRIESVSSEFSREP